MRKKSRLFWAGCLIAVVGAGVLGCRILFPRNAPRWYLYDSRQSEVELKGRFAWSYLRAYCLGVTAAAEDLARNKAVLVTIGHTDEKLDERTGLTILTQGSVADRGMFGYAAGYNRIVDVFIRLRGIPSNSRKPWEQILSNVNEYFDSRAKDDPPLQLVVDGKPVIMSDGRQVSFLSHENPNHKVIYYDLKWGNEIYPLLTFYPHSDDTMQFYPGPPGSDFVVLRGGDGNQFVYPGIERVTVTIALDLRFGMILGQAEKANN